MSLASYFELLNWKPSRPSRRAPIEIDSSPDAVPIQATLSELNEFGEVEFVRNVALWVMRGVPVGLHFPDESNATLDAGCRCWAIVAQAMSPEDDELVKDCTFSAAAWPYSRGWWGDSPFKPRWNGSQESLRKRAAKNVHDLADWRDFIRDLPENPFSTEKSVRKAVLIDPNRIHETIIPGRYFNVTRPSTSGEKGTRIPLVPSMCYGLTKVPDACRAALVQDPLVGELIEATLDRSLFLRFHSWHPQLDVSRHPLVEPLTNTERANEVLATAITLALAGPDRFDKFRAYPDPRGHPRKMVATLVRDIYVELMWNLQRCAKTALKGRAPKPAAVEPETSPRADADDSAAVAESAVGELVEKLKTQSQEEIDSLLLRLLHDFDQPAEVRWEVAEGVPVADAAPDQSAEMLEKLWECCLLAAALFRLGVRDPRLAACVRELADDPSPNLQKLARLFLHFVQ